MKKIATKAVPLIVVALLIGGAIFAAHHNITANKKKTSKKYTSIAQAIENTASNTVIIQNASFQPGNLTVKQGTTVSWGNLDTVSYSVVENDGQNGPNSGEIKPDGHYDFTFKTPGVFKYHSSLQANVNGTITVTPVAGADSAKASASTYSGWKTYKLTNEKLSFKYPKNWQIKDTSTSGKDTITLSGTDGFTASIQSGISTPPTLSTSPVILYTETATVAGQPVNLDFLSSSQNPALVGQVYVSENTTDATGSPLAARNTKGYVILHAGYPDSNPGLKLQDTSKDQNYLVTKNILISMHY